MRKKEVIRLKEQLDQLDQQKTRKLDKMSMSFVLPLVLFYAAVGLLLILLNDFVTNVAAWALAVGLVLVGGWLLLRYLHSDTEKRLAGADMAIGLILLLAGILLIASPTDMKEVFPKIWGLSLIFGGFLKIQYAFDEKSVKVTKWWIMLIFAAVSLVIGILALLNRTVFGENQHLIIGIFMLGEAVLDLVTYFLISHGMKKQTVEKEVAMLEAMAAAKAAADVPAAPAVDEPRPGDAPQEE